MPNSLPKALPREAILASFVTRYGEKVLSAPTASGFNLAAWVTPFLVILIGAVSIGLIGAPLGKKSVFGPSGIVSNHLRTNGPVSGTPQKRA